MKTLTFSFKNRQYYDLPQEDSFLYKDNIFAVGDGITRDVDPYDWSGISQQDLLKSYPKESPAKKAADIFCNTLINEFNGNLKNSFIKANDNIRRLNEKENPNPDFLVNDFFACVGAAAFIKDNKLFWANIGDCKITVFDKSGKIKFDSPNGLDNFKEHVKDWRHDWSNPEHRIDIRKNYRNNPNQLHNGKCVSYGALTGQKEAELFIQDGSTNLSENDIVLVYSDGFIDTINHKDFFSTILSADLQKAVEEFSNKLAEIDVDRFGRERTLILTFL